MWYANKQGQLAYKDGKVLEDNPYSVRKNPAEYQAWRQAWLREELSIV